MGLSTFDETQPYVFGVSINNGNGTSNVNMTASLIHRYRVDAILVSNSDSSARILNLSLSALSGTWRIGSLSIPARTGYDGNAALDFLASMPEAVRSVVALLGSWFFVGNLDVAVASGQTVTVTFVGGEL